ncbi:hypothetical protein YH65_08310 [Sulfurovum lithotrophicum]|uniref:Uncharacterized protein n=1 Tax=Sulfurovum lithotrophicum TaxID=206403 RepID=A0A7U4M203_9BACT|nr:hypothetical protein [Sulfurovum lithotrophicum]AKF25390.1 hypothetical protein YH65_08310 [Sulfurovum lithotrophicum]
MKLSIIAVLLSFTIVMGFGSEHNTTKENNSTIDNNKTKEAVKKAMELEKKYAKEQRFYQGSEYDLKSKEFDPETLKKVPAIEPDYDFDMDEGVYSD